MVYGWVGFFLLLGRVEGSVQGHRVGSRALGEGKGKGKGSTRARSARGFDVLMWCVLFCLIDGLSP